MKITTAKNFRDNLSEMIDELIKSNEQLKVTNKNYGVVSFRLDVVKDLYYNCVTM